MSTAVFLVVFIAFVARVVLSGAAIRNALFAIGLAVVAVGAYAGIRLSMFEIGDLIRGTGSLIALSAIMLALGYGIPAFMTDAERKGRLVRTTAFFLGVVTAVVAADVWRITGGLPMALVVTPHFWFGIGVACFLVFKARVFEDVMSAD